MEWVRAHDMKFIPRAQGNVLYIWCPCKHLDKKNKCKIYKNRPDNCRQNPTRETLFLQPSCCAYWEAWKTSPEGASEEKDEHEVSTEEVILEDHELSNDLHDGDVPDNVGDNG
jgi:Fe-S-cluster containining protein